MLQKLKELFLKVMIFITVSLLAVFFFNKLARTFFSAVLIKQLNKANKKDKKLQQEIEQLKKQESEIDANIAKIDNEIKSTGSSKDADWHKK